MAKKIKIAGIYNGNELFAILDKRGRTMFQIWSTEEKIKLKYTLKP